MKIFGMIILIFLNAAAFAEEKAPVPAGGSQGCEGQQGCGMGEEQRDAHLRKMQDHMLKMHDYMHQIRDAKDEKEKNSLKDEQLKLMKEHMKSMPGHGHGHMEHKGMMQPAAPGK